MRIYTVKCEGLTKVAIGYKDRGNLYLLEDFGLYFKDVNDFIQNATRRQIEILKDFPRESILPIKGSLEILSPIPSPLQDIICLGINYADHAEESEKFDEKIIKKERSHTVYFSKRVNEAVPPGGNIPLYEEIVDSLDYEVELGVIIGKDAKNVLREDAYNYIFGYTIINDISARNIQMQHSQWYFGKSFDGFTPMGPCIVLSDEISNAGNLELASYVNGELRQKSNTNMLIKNIPEIIEELSKGITLKAGTIIATGTPAGVAFSFNPPKYLKDGDKVECRIEKIGSLINTVKK